MEKCGKKWKMMKKGNNILLKKAKLIKNQKNNICWISSGKYGKMWKKVKNDEKGSYIAEKGPIDEKWKK